MDRDIIVCIDLGDPEHELRAIDHAKTTYHEFVVQRAPEDVRDRHIVTHGSIYREILHYADEAKSDLAVITAATLGPEDYLLGPNAAHVAHQTRISRSGCALNTWATARSRGGVLGFATRFKSAPGVSTS